MKKQYLVGEEYLRSILDAFPSPVLLVDKNLSIHDANAASKQLLRYDIGKVGDGHEIMRFHIHSTMICNQNAKKIKNRCARRPAPYYLPGARTAKAFFQ